MLNPGRVLSKSQILDHVWQYDWGGDANIVESYISYLRRKIDQLDGRRRHAGCPRSSTPSAGVGLPAARVVVTADVVLEQPARDVARRRARAARRASARCGDWWAGTTLVSRLVGIVTVLLAVGLVLAGATSAALLEGTLVGQVDSKLQTEGEDLAQSTVASLSRGFGSGMAPSDYYVRVQLDGVEDLTREHLARRGHASTAPRTSPT